MSLPSSKDSNGLFPSLSKESQEPWQWPERSRDLWLLRSSILVPATLFTAHSVPVSLASLQLLKPAISSCHRAFACAVSATHTCPKYLQLVLSIQGSIQISSLTPRPFASLLPALCLQNTYGHLKFYIFVYSLFPHQNVGFTETKTLATTPAAASPVPETALAFRCLVHLARPSVLFKLKTTKE